MECNEREPMTIRNKKLWLIKGSKTHSNPCGDFRSADHLQALIKPPWVQQPLRKKMKKF